MKYINSRMFEFLMKERPFGICITDKADKAYGKLKPYGKVFRDENFLELDDLQMGLEHGQKNDLASFIRLQPEFTRGKLLTVGSYINEKKTKKTYGIDNVMRFLVHNEIGFQFDYSLTYEEEQLCIRTEYDDNIFFYSEDGKNYHLRNIFCKYV